MATEPQPATKLGSTTPEETQARVISQRAVSKGKRTINAKAKRLGKLKIVYLPVDKIKPNDWNPNRQSEHDFELLCRSMEEDGFTDPLLLNKTPDENGMYTIEDGEHRWRAAITLGITEVPCVLLDHSEAQARIATIRHNRARGSHDIELEAEVLKDLRELGELDWAKDALMLDDTELDKMLNDVAAPEALAGEEYSGAWVPSDLTAAERDQLALGTLGTDGRQEDLTAEGGAILRGMTPQAIEASRAKEKEIAEAKTEQDRMAAQQDVQYIYRVALLYSGEEGKIVKQALGDQPAVTLLAMCQDKVKQDAAAAPEAEGA